MRLAEQRALSQSTKGMKGGTFQPKMDLFSHLLHGQGSSSPSHTVFRQSTDFLDIHDAGKKDTFIKKTI